MLKLKYKFTSILLMVIFSFISSYLLVLQTYEHRSTFALLESLKLEKEELSFQSNILIEEVQFSKNQISLRKYAVESLGMRTPTFDERVYLTGRIEK
mgnify:CR=1 FL=1|tara:strand:+ start:422 stop:712 length:291 start_codon:yes stop_codon:yes gene_type:complete